MSHAVEYDIHRYRGDTHAESFRLKLDGTVQNITGDTIRLAVDKRKEPSGTTSSPTLDGPGEQFVLTATIPVGTDGVFEFAPSAAQSNIQKGTYYYDVEWNDGSEIRTIMYGKWVVTEDRTKV